MPSGSVVYDSKSKRHRWHKDQNKIEQNKFTKISFIKQLQKHYNTIIYIDDNNEYYKQAHTLGIKTIPISTSGLNATHINKIKKILMKR